MDCGGVRGLTCVWSSVITSTDHGIWRVGASGGGMNCAAKGGNEVRNVVMAVG